MVDAPKKLSLLDATLLVMGGIIGVGIFFTPSQAALGARDPWAFAGAWTAGGVIALFAAFTFAELGGTFPRTGGWFVYLREAFGPFPAFLFAWIVLFVVSTGACAGVAQFLASQAAAVFPDRIGTGAGPGGGGSPGSGWSIGERELASLVVLAITAVALSGVKRTVLVQNACMAIKLAVLAAFVFLGTVWLAPGSLPRPADAPEPGSLWLGSLGAMRSVFFAYGGWQIAAYVAPEIREPARNLPRAMVLGVLGVIVVYLAANLSYLRVLGVEGLAATPDFAARIAGEALGPAGGRVLAAGMAISALGFSIVTLLATPWLYVAMSEAGLFFERFGRLTPRTRVPALALAVQAAVTIVYIYTAGRAYLVDAIVFVEWIFHGLVALALLRLRRARPDLPRPFRSPLYPLAPIVYAAAAVVLVVSTLFTAPVRLTMTGLAIVAAGALVYRPWRWAVGRAQG